MMKKKSSLLIGTMLIGISMLGGETVRADMTSSGYIPLNNQALRDAFIGFSSQEEYEAFNKYGAITEETASRMRFLLNGSNSLFTSVEGFEYLKNLETWEAPVWYNITDFRKASTMPKLYELAMENTASVPTLDFMENWENLEIVQVEIGESTADQKHSKVGDNLALTDISALNDKENLAIAEIVTRGKFPTISMRNGYRKYEVFDPIILSSHFEGCTIEYSSSDINFTNTDGLLKWNAVPQDAKELDLKWKVVNGGNFSFKGEAKIPIVWK